MIEQNSVPIFTPDWGADEELLLLEGATIYGLGSWADIADHIGGYRTKEEVRDHYIDTYIDSPNFPLPALADPNDRQLQDELPKDEFQARKKRRIEERKEAAKAAPPTTPKQKPIASHPSCHEVQGYMPGRLEFETELANEAEEAVQHMQFEPGTGLMPNGELEPEMELKMTVKDIYNSRLDARVERKKIIFEHNLLEYRKNTAQDKKRTKDERDLLNKAKPFARMMNHEDYEDFIKGLEYEHNLRIAIAQLQEWRRMGVADLRSGETYEHDKIQRLQQRVLVPGAGSGGGGGGIGAGAAGGGAAGLGSSAFSSSALGARQSKSLATPDTTSTAVQLTMVELPPRLQRAVAAGTGGAPDGRSGAGEANGVGANGAGTNGVGGMNGNGSGSGNGNGNDNGNGSLEADASNNDNNNSGTRLDTPKPRPKYSVPPVPGLMPWRMDSQQCPDLHLLTREEVELCSVIHMQPKPYLVVKEHLIREAMKQGGLLKRKDVKAMAKVGVFFFFFCSVLLWFVLLLLC